MNTGDRVKTPRFGAGTVLDVYVIAGTEYADVRLDDFPNDRIPSMFWVGDLNPLKEEGAATEAENLISDLAECHADLAAWARDKISEGSTVAEIKVMMREAARLVGRV